ncbi:MAG: EF-hand domain-containing protein, partial [archaeon]|nr:EF-hand domain-containing protein [archaeon]
MTDTKDEKGNPIKLQLDLKSVKRRNFQPQELRYLSKLFQEIDVDNGGTIEAEEIQAAMKRMGSDMSLEEIQERMKDADKNGNGCLSFREFCNFLAKVENIQIGENPAGQKKELQPPPKKLSNIPTVKAQPKKTSMQLNLEKLAKTVETTPDKFTSTNQFKSDDKRQFKFKNKEIEYFIVNPIEPDGEVTIKYAGEDKIEKIKVSEFMTVQLIKIKTQRKTTLQLNLEKLAKTVETTPDKFTKTNQFKSDENRYFKYKVQEIEYFIVNPIEPNGEVTIKYKGKSQTEKMKVVDFLIVQLLRGNPNKKTSLQMNLENLAQALKTTPDQFTKTNQFKSDDRRKFKIKNKEIEYFIVNPVEPEGEVTIKYLNEPQTEIMKVYDFMDIQIINYSSRPGQGGNSGKKTSLQMNLENLAEALETTPDKFTLQHKYMTDDKREFRIKDKDIEYFIINPIEPDGEVTIKYKGEDQTELMKVYDFMEIDITNISDEATDGNLQKELEALAKCLGVPDFKTKNTFKTEEQIIEFRYEGKIIEYFKVNYETGEIEIKFKGESELKIVNVHTFNPLINIRRYAAAGGSNPRKIAMCMENLSKQLGVSDFNNQNEFHSDGERSFNYDGEEIESFKVDPNGIVLIKFKNGRTLNSNIDEFMPKLKIITNAASSGEGVKLRAIPGAKKETNLSLDLKAVKRRNFTPEELRYLSKLFAKIDADNSGAIEAEEIQRAMHAMGVDMDLDEIELRMKDADSNCNGSLSFREFCNFVAKVDNIEIGESMFEERKLNNPQIGKLKSGFGSGNKTNLQNNLERLANKVETTPDKFTKTNQFKSDDSKQFKFKNQVIEYFVVDPIEPDGLVTIKYLNQSQPQTMKVSDFLLVQLVRLKARSSSGKKTSLQMNLENLAQALKTTPDQFTKTNQFKSDDRRKFKIKNKEIEYFIVNPVEPEGEVTIKYLNEPQTEIMKVYDFMDIQIINYSSRPGQGGNSGKKTSLQMNLENLAEALETTPDKFTLQHKYMTDDKREFRIKDKDIEYFIINPIEPDGEVTIKYKGEDQTELMKVYDFMEIDITNISDEATDGNLQKELEALAKCLGVPDFKT